MDWNALGTWAAVVVALSLALREGLTRSSERRAVHLLTCARIMPSSRRMDDMLRETLEESEIIDPGAADSSLLLDACETFAARLHDNGLGRFRGDADQIGALPHDVLVPLVKVLMLEEMLLENHAIEASKAVDGQEAREVFQIWQEQMRAMRVSLRWVIKGTDQRMKSWRWRHPEIGFLGP